MIIKETPFKDLLIIENTPHLDKRGSFTEVFKKEIVENHLGYDINFCQENLVKSKKNVLRGLHFQINPFAQSKLISVLSGEILDIAVDIRKESKTYGKYFSYNLSSRKNESLFIPKGFAHGYLTISNDTSILYKVDNYYNPEMERGISFEDDFLKINLGIEFEKLIISKKDKKFKFFEW